MVRSLLYCLLLLVYLLHRPAFAADIKGGTADEELFGTSYSDTFYGGDGADTFVINYLSGEEDVILDFDPDEGDRIALSFPSAFRPEFKIGNLRMSKFGVLQYQLDQDTIDIVDTKRQNMTFEADFRKGRYLLKFELPVKQ